MDEWITVTSLIKDVFISLPRILTRPDTLKEMRVFKRGLPDRNLCICIQYLGSCNTVQEKRISCPLGIWNPWRVLTLERPDNMHLALLVAKDETTRQLLWVIGKAKVLVDKFGWIHMPPPPIYWDKWELEYDNPGGAKSPWRGPLPLGTSPCPSWVSISASIQKTLRKVSSFSYVDSCLQIWG